MELVYELWKELRQSKSADPESVVAETKRKYPQMPERDMRNAISLGLQQKYLSLWGRKLIWNEQGTPNTYEPPTLAELGLHVREIITVRKGASKKRIANDLVNTDHYVYDKVFKRELGRLLEDGVRDGIYSKTGTKYKLFRPTKKRKVSRLGGTTGKEPVHKKEPARKKLSRKMHSRKVRQRRMILSGKAPGRKKKNCWSWEG